MLRWAVVSFGGVPKDRSAVVRIGGPPKDRSDTDASVSRRKLRWRTEGSDFHRKLRSGAGGIAASAPLLVQTTACYAARMPLEAADLPAASTARREHVTIINGQPSSREPSGYPPSTPQHRLPSRARVSPS